MCHRVLVGKSCPNCGSEDVSPDWKGFVVILDPEKSEIARRLNIKEKGKFALKVR
jgi:DNA-directed RNA polymerase subunit E"